MTQKLAWSGIATIALCIAGVAHSAPKKTYHATKASEGKATKQDVLLIAGLQSNFDLQFEPCPALEDCVRVTNKIVEVQYSQAKNQLIFTPQKKGETTVTIRDAQGDIRLILHAIVSESNLVRQAKELRYLLRDIEGLDIKILGQKIIIDGEVVSINDLNRYYSVIGDSAYKDILTDLVTVSPVAIQIMSEKIQAEINNPNVKVRPFNGLFLIEGSVDKEGDKKAIEDIARSMLQGYVVPRLNVPETSPIEVRRLKVQDPLIVRLTVAAQKPKPAEKMLRITVDFVELSKDYARQFGFVWAPSLNADGGSIAFGQSTTGGVTTQGSGSLAGTITNLFPKLNAAQNAGYARVLEETVLILKNNSPGEVKRVTTIPVPIAATTSTATLSTYKDAAVGLTLNVTPSTVGGSDDVDMKIDFAYKGLAGRTQQAPIILDHGYKGFAIVKSGESTALVNVLSNTIATTFNKDVPGGGQLPQNPLFSLLRSKSFLKNKSQFVVFLTPQIIESSSQGTDDIKQKYGLRKRQ